jgi:hypothetical protein
LPAWMKKTARCRGSRGRRCARRPGLAPPSRTAPAQQRRRAPSDGSPPPSPPLHP